MSSDSGYAGRHRDPVPPVAGAAATGQSHHPVWLVAGAVAVVMLLFSVLIYPSLTSNSTPQTGRPAATSPTSDPGLQFLGVQEGGRTGSESATTSTTSTADPTSTAEPATASAEVPSASLRAPVSTAPRSTSSTPAPGTTPPGSSLTSSGTPSTDNPRAVAQALFPDFGFPANEFGCLNATWNRLGLWSTAAAVRPGLIYVKGRYGTPCAAWDHVRTTGNY